MGIGKLVNVILHAIPYRAFLKLYPSLSKTIMSEIADRVYKTRFFSSSLLVHKAETVEKKVRVNKKHMTISKGIWDYQLANFCFIKDMLPLIIWCVELGYIPVILINPNNPKYYTNSLSLWDMYYKQPLDSIEGYTLCNCTCPIITSPIRPNFSDIFDQKKVAFWHEILEHYVVYSQDVKQYFDKEYNELINHKSVVACVLRSTDYVKTRPIGHPIQPSLEEVFAKIYEVMELFGAEYIYLATEDYMIAEAFKKEFPSRVIENKRRYYNEVFDEEQLERVSEVHFNRENDDYLKMLEYMSSINLVSKCDFLVTGLNGGSEMAIYRNGNRYQYAYVFDKGVY